MFNIFIGTVDRIYSAAQLLHRSTSWNIASCLVSFFCIINGVKANTPLPTIALYSLGVPAMVKLSSGFILFLFERPWLKNVFKHIKTIRFKKDLSSDVYKENWFFFVNQVISLVMLETDYIIIAQLFGTDKVAVYAVSIRLSTTAVGFLSAYASPLWPAIAEAKNHRDYTWMRTCFLSARKRTMSVAMGVFVFLLFAGPLVVRKWTRGLFDPPLALMAASGFYLLTVSWCQLHALLFNGLGIIKEQSKVVSITAFCNLIFSYLLGKKYGLSGVCWGTSLSCFLSCLWYAKRSQQEFKRVMLFQKEHPLEDAYLS